MTDHWSPTAVHFEAFSEADIHKATDRPFKVKLAKSGKVLEVPVKKILKGIPVERAASKESLANPEALDLAVELAAARA